MEQRPDEFIVITGLGHGCQVASLLPVRVLLFVGSGVPVGSMPLIRGTAALSVPSDSPLRHGPMAVAA
jgi:hypothetical protein